MPPLPVTVSNALQQTSPVMQQFRSPMQSDGAAGNGRRVKAAIANNSRARLSPTNNLTDPLGHDHDDMALFDPGDMGEGDFLGSNMLAADF